MDHVSEINMDWLIDWLIVNMRTSEGVYFAYMGRRNPWTDRVQFLFGYRDPGRNHVYQISWRSVEGFLVGGVPKFALSHWLWSSSLQQCYATACTVIYIEEQSCQISFWSNLKRWSLRLFEYYVTPTRRTTTVKTERKDEYRHEISSFLIQKY